MQTENTESGGGHGQPPTSLVTVSSGDQQNNTQGEGGRRDAQVDGGHADLPGINGSSRGRLPGFEGGRSPMQTENTESGGGHGQPPTSLVTVSSGDQQNNTQGEGGRRDAQVDGGHADLPGINGSSRGRLPGFEGGRSPMQTENTESGGGHGQPPTSLVTVSSGDQQNNTQGEGGRRDAQVDGGHADLPGINGSSRGRLPGFEGGRSPMQTENTESGGGHGQPPTSLVTVSSGDQQNNTQGEGGRRDAQVDGGHADLPGINGSSRGRLPGFEGGRSPMQTENTESGGGHGQPPTSLVTVSSGDQQNNTQGEGGRRDAQVDGGHADLPGINGSSRGRLPGFEGGRSPMQTENTESGGGHGQPPTSLVTVSSGDQQNNTQGEGGRRDAQVDGGHADLPGINGSSRGRLPGFEGGRSPMQTENTESGGGHGQPPTSLVTVSSGDQQNNTQGEGGRRDAQVDGGHADLPGINGSSRGRLPGFEGGRSPMQTENTESGGGHGQPPTSLVTVSSGDQQNNTQGEGGRRDAQVDGGHADLPGINGSSRGRLPGFEGGRSPMQTENTESGGGHGQPPTSLVTVSSGDQQNNTQGEGGRRDAQVDGGHADLPGINGSSRGRLPGFEGGRSPMQTENTESGGGHGQPPTSLVTVSSGDQQNNTQGEGGRRDAQVDGGHADLPGINGSSRGRLPGFEGGRSPMQTENTESGGGHGQPPTSLVTVSSGDQQNNTQGEGGRRDAQVDGGHADLPGINGSSRGRLPGFEGGRSPMQTENTESGGGHGQPPTSLVTVSSGDQQNNTQGEGGRRDAQVDGGHADLPGINGSSRGRLPGFEGGRSPMQTENTESGGGHGQPPTSLVTVSSGDQQNNTQGEGGRRDAQVDGGHADLPGINGSSRGRLPGFEGGRSPMQTENTESGGGHGQPPTSLVTVSSGDQQNNTQGEGGRRDAQVDGGHADLPGINGSSRGRLPGFEGGRSPMQTENTESGGGHGQPPTSLVTVSSGDQQNNTQGEGGRRDAQVDGGHADLPGINGSSRGRLPGFEGGRSPMQTENTESGGGHGQPPTSLVTVSSGDQQNNTQGEGGRRDAQVDGGHADLPGINGSSRGRLPGFEGGRSPMQTENTESGGGHGQPPTSLVTVSSGDQQNNTQGEGGRRDAQVDGGHADLPGINGSSRGRLPGFEGGRSPMQTENTESGGGHGQPPTSLVTVSSGDQQNNTQGEGGRRDAQVDGGHADLPGINGSSRGRLPGFEGGRSPMQTENTESGGGHGQPPTSLVTVSSGDQQNNTQGEGGRRDAQVDGGHADLPGINGSSRGRLPGFEGGRSPCKLRTLNQVGDTVSLQRRW
ncbi:unnamed protein product [Heterobilharzia americana]|nr:unnamed protein product [Heterobilharzia americana]